MSTIGPINERILKIMCQVFDCSPESLDEESSVDSIERWDSLGHMNLVVSLEEEFGIRFQEEDVPVMTNFRLVKCMVEQEVPK